MSEMSHIQMYSNRRFSSFWKFTHDFRAWDVGRNRPCGHSGPSCANGDSVPSTETGIHELLLSMQENSLSETKVVKANHTDTWFLRLAELLPKM